jgi:predicted transcriptional regulator
MPELLHKGYRVYVYLALGRLFSALGLNADQPGLEDLLDRAIQDPSSRVSKEEIMHLIRSNSTMTQKVLDSLSEEGLASVVAEPKGYDIRITRKGVGHFLRYRNLYSEIYQKELSQHFRYVGVPGWLAQPDGTPRKGG